MKHYFRNFNFYATKKKKLDKEYKNLKYVSL